ncbi:fimbrial major subunit CsuA/B family protein [Rahnella sp. SAP-1]|jgi:spore coat protein U-like protein|uniref:Fimbrial major subunit CsuA/B family protein n=1 Tax=Rouxiella aceris TaxID=2703884 RepID=A0A848MEU0_9GAMM|nr:spore coat protein U domain-containing protein [Rouxiella aceris]NMP25719.1 fimbrial major subunit CsuA/B family protein [Rouxiella aceris]
MGTKHIAISALLSAATFSLSPTALAAGTLTGQIGVQLTISTGCTVGNGTNTGGTNQWGNINFGNYADLTSVINGTLLGANGTSAVTVTCNTGLTPTLSLGAGSNSTAGLRAMSAGGATTIPYRLYSDTARTSEIAVNTPVALAIGAQNFPIYARVLPADQTSTTPAAGTYSDIVLATLAW